MNKKTFTSQKPSRQISNYRLSLLAVPCAFGLGMFGAQNSELSLVVIALVIGLLIIRAQFWNKSKLRTPSETKMHWPSFVLPSAIALNLYSPPIFVLLLVLLIGLSLLEKNSKNVQIKIGPLVLLFASTMITVPTLNPRQLIVPLLFFTLIFRLITTVKTQDLVRSIIHGYGFFCFANVVAHYFGLTSPRAKFRTGGLIESTGFSRVIFPFSESVNSLPILAAVVILALLLSHRDSLNTTASFQYVYLLSSILILHKSGNRASPLILLFAIALVVSRIKLLRISAIWVTPLAVLSSLYLPFFSAQLGKIVVPIVSTLTTGRDPLSSNSFTFQGRTIIWEKSIEFWQEWVNSPLRQFFGYGRNGQFVSGASQTYSRLLESISLNPEFSGVHNLFLQQLFDGGLLGVFLLASSLIWSCTRMSKVSTRADISYLIACLALIMFTLFGVVEHFLAPGTGSQLSWAIAMFIGVSCQFPIKKVVDSTLYEFG
jgi:hypothetical protein